MHWKALAFAFFLTFCRTLAFQITNADSGVEEVLYDLRSLDRPLRLESQEFKVSNQDLPGTPETLNEVLRNTEAKVFSSSKKDPVIQVSNGLKSDDAVEENFLLGELFGAALSIGSIPLCLCVLLLFLRLRDAILCCLDYFRHRNAPGIVENTVDPEIASIFVEDRSETIQRKG